LENIPQYITTPLKGHPNIHIRRLDLLPEEENGNKGFKLKYNLTKALEMQNPHILTFGGYYSNHLHAAAAACEKKHIKLTAVIRGEEPKTYGKTLNYLADHGAQLHFVSRSAYSDRDDKSFLDELKKLYGPYHLIPEGGANVDGVLGCAEILQDGDEIYTHICCASGTGTMAAGLAKAMKPDQHLIAFSALAGGEFLKQRIAQLCQVSGVNSNEVEDKLRRTELITDYHFGGYAKWNDELIQFIRSFYEREKIPLEQVYTGKMMFGLSESLIHRGDLIPPGSRVLVIHSGGLQGALPELSAS
jgi:1-aminocyclopropane-1-carboxylate deaminase/D-cysteine desulfhydrase-like pyridoxal-dependent ACC family enzyme